MDFSHTAIINERIRNVIDRISNIQGLDPLFLEYVFSFSIHKLLVLLIYWLMYIVNYDRGPLMAAVFDCSRKILKHICQP